MQAKTSWVMILTLWSALGASRAIADEYPVENYHNYYYDEGQHDWAKNCRVTAVLPPIGSSFPAQVRLGFKFARDVGGAGYFKGASFDLATAEPGSPFTYVQLRTPRTLSGTVSTVVFTNPVSINLAPGSTVRIPFEIYVDCDACSWPEGKPPSADDTTWRIFGEIACAADANGKVASCVIENVGSEQPLKRLKSVNPHNSDHFPNRKLPRPAYAGAPACEPGAYTCPCVSTNCHQVECCSSCGNVKCGVCRQICHPRHARCFRNRCRR